MHFPVLSCRSGGDGGPGLDGAFFLFSFAIWPDDDSCFTKFPVIETPNTGWRVAAPV